MFAYLWYWKKSNWTENLPFILVKARLFTQTSIKKMVSSFGYSNKMFVWLIDGYHTVKIYCCNPVSDMVKKNKTKKNLLGFGAKTYRPVNCLIAFFLLQTIVTISAFNNPPSVDLHCTSFKMHRILHLQVVNENVEPLLVRRGLQNNFIHLWLFHTEHTIASY